MSRRVFYLMSGAAHCPYLVTSLYSLREIAGYDGEIEVYAWPESMEVVERIAQDTNLAISPILNRQPAYRGKNAQFLDKIRLSMTMHSGTNIYLDADTMPVQSIEDLFEEAEHNFVATQFGSWLSNSGLPQKRVKRLYEFFGNHTGDCVDAVHWIDSATSLALPSPNGGVFAFSGKHQYILAQWELWTDAVKKKVFIADEACLHLIVAKYIGRGLFVMPGEYNASPKHKSCPDEDVKIWHFHGDSNVRMNDEGEFKSVKGWETWSPVYHHCLSANVGGLAEWVGDVGNEYLNKRLDDLL